MKEPSLFSQCVAEFFGVGLFLFLGPCVVLAWSIAGADMDWWGICITWGFAITLAVFLTAGISGGHLNPAVTVALWLFGNFPANKVLPYSLAQIAGGAFGAFMAYVVYQGLILDFESTHNMVRGSVESLSLAGAWTTYAHPLVSTGAAFLVETVLTATLVGLIFALTDDGNGVPKGPMAPILIGILVAVIGAACGPLTGFAMNPARDFGPKIFLFFAGWGETAFTGGRDIPYFLVPFFAPLLGGIIGGLGYRFFITKNLPTPAAEQKEAIE
ncbi:MAG: MIP/aquaporin family protein [Vibrio sp.]